MFVRDSDERRQHFTVTYFLCFPPLLILCCTPLLILEEINCNLISSIESHIQHKFPHFFFIFGRPRINYSCENTQVLIQLCTSFLCTTIVVQSFAHLHCLAALYNVMFGKTFMRCRYLPFQGNWGSGWCIVLLPQVCGMPDFFFFFFNKCTVLT